MELAGSGIEVSLIEPGPIASKFTTNAIAYIERFIDLKNSVHRVEYERQMRRLRARANPPRQARPGCGLCGFEARAGSKETQTALYCNKAARQGALLKKLLPAALFYRIIGRLG